MKRKVSTLLVSLAAFATLVAGLPLVAALPP